MDRKAPALRFTDDPTKKFVDTTKLIVDTAAMARRASSRPTDAELDILRVLWARGPSTVEQVHDIRRS